MIARHPHLAAWLKQFFADATHLEPILEPLRTPDPAAPGWPTIRGYRIVRQLGRGGMGVVYEAEQLIPMSDDPLRRTVALKTIRPELVASRQHRLIHENDIRIAAQLAHANIAPILEVGPADGPLYFTMPYMRGGSLADRTSPLSSREAAEMLLPIVRAVEYLHTQKVIHLDLKPANILLDADGKPHVSDFGLSRLLPPDGDSYVSQGLGGTLQYMGPEHAGGHLGVSCDLYGLGAVLYHMLTGRPPFCGATPAETLSQVLEQEPVAPRLLNPSVDRDLQTVCLCCLEKKPERRYANAAKLAADLECYLKGEPVTRVPWWEWLRRQVHFRSHLDQAALWSRIAFASAGFSLLAHAAMYLLMQFRPPTVLYWLWLLAFECGDWALIVLCLRGRRRLDPSERGLLLNWIAATGADVLLFGLFCPPFREAAPEVVAGVYPVWMTIQGLKWIMEARTYWGRLYILGLAFFLVAALMPLRMDLAPLVFGVANTAGLAWLGIGLRRIAARRAPGR